MLPSGRVNIYTAHMICALLLLGAMVAGYLYSNRTPQRDMVLLQVVPGCLVDHEQLLGDALCLDGHGVVGSQHH